MILDNEHLSSLCANRGSLCVCASARVSPSVMHITVVGGGNSTPIFAALAKDAGHEVATAAPRMAETRELSR